MGSEGYGNQTPEDSWDAPGSHAAGAPPPRPPPAQKPSIFLDSAASSNIPLRLLRRAAQGCQGSVKTNAAPLSPAQGKAAGI